MRQVAQPQQRSVVAWFKGDLLERLDAPALPTEREFVDSISTSQPPSRPRVLALTDEQRKALPVPARTEPAVDATPAGAARTYPPLEPQ